MNNDCHCTFELTSKNHQERYSAPYKLPCETAVKFLKGLEPYPKSENGFQRSVQIMKIERSECKYTGEQKIAPWLAAQKIDLFKMCGTCLSGAVPTKPEEKNEVYFI